MLRRSHKPLLLACLALSTAAGCNTTGGRSGVAALVADGDFRGAVELAEEQVADNPDDPGAREALRDARVAQLLDVGRQVLFADRNEDALDIFNQALALDPTNAVTAAWIEKARRKLGAIWLEAALELTGNDLPAALEAFEIALYYQPDDVAALDGAARAVFLMNHRKGLGEQYYNQGVDALHGYRLILADYEFDKTLKYLPDDERAADRDAQAALALAEGRLVVAKSLEGEGLWSAAANEYRLVLLLDPENEEAVEGRERTALEVRAKNLLAEADMLIRQNRLQEALAKLEEGRALTSYQQDAFAFQVNEIEIVHWESMYQKALILELDFQYTQAVVAYRALLEEAEFYADAEVRLATLEDFIDRAERLYARILDSDDPDEQRTLLRQIDTFWPEYRDVQTRLSELEEAEAEEAAAAPDAQAALPTIPRVTLYAWIEDETGSYCVGF